jgi:hypothetical protein
LLTASPLLTTLAGIKGLLARVEYKRTSRAFG